MHNRPEASRITPPLLQVRMNSLLRNTFNIRHYTAPSPNRRNDYRSDNLESLAAPHNPGIDVNGHETSSNQRNTTNRKASHKRSQRHAKTCRHLEQVEKIGHTWRHRGPRPEKD